ncbi:hypothetical protein JXA12_01320 [Candidatus Woesearchaeota archaeon]|nr:hypothetical protein [Candidatus Woesearchaeota archaeon]
MGFSEINRYVSVSRWQKVLENEKSRIKDTHESLFWKATICGLLAGDGSVHERRMKNGMHREVRLYADDPVMVATYNEAMQKVYGKHPSTRIRDNVCHVRLTSKTVVQDLLRVGRFGTKEWRVPFQLLEPQERKIAWLKGFFSGEACVGEKNIRVQTINNAGMKDVSALLNHIGITHRTYSYNPRPLNHHEVHIISINRRQARKRYCERIGFWHGKKTEKLKKTVRL